MFEWIQIYDHAALLWLQEHFRNAVLNTFMVFYTRLGNGGLLIFLAIALLLVRKETRRYALIGLCGLAIGYGVIHLVKITRRAGSETSVQVQSVQVSRKSRER